MLPLLNININIVIITITITNIRFSVYGDWECKRHRVFLPFGQQKEPYDKVIMIVMMMMMMMIVMMVMVLVLVMVMVRMMMVNGDDGDERRMTNPIYKRFGTVAT